MKKIIVSEHVSLDGFVAGPAGEMDWIKLDVELFDYVGKITAQADTALYGRKTFQMMDSYWPTAANKPNASKHDKEHAQWYNSVKKVILSRTWKDMQLPETTIISSNLSKEINKIKAQPGKNILCFGSPETVHSLLECRLVDEFYLFINPVLLGRGIPLFNRVETPMKLKRLSDTFFPCGVIALHYIADNKE
jgi:dihydrofolate reductase